VNRDRKLVLLIFALTFGYSLLRYIVFKGVSVEQIPVYITNKAVSWTGLILLGLAPLIHVDRRRTIGQAGFLFVILHVIMSLMIFNSVYFAKFYSEVGYLLWQAEASMLAGAVGTVLLLKLFVHVGENNNHNGSLILGLGRLILILTGAHLGLMGYRSWSDAEHWPGHLPPITLLSFLTVIVLLGLRQLRR
jgi:hypothetical protein